MVTPKEKNGKPLSKKKFIEKVVLEFKPGSPDNFICLKQDDGSTAEVGVGSMNKKDAEDRFYREYLQILAHNVNMENVKSPVPAPQEGWREKINRRDVMRMLDDEPLEEETPSNDYAPKFVIFAPIRDFPRIPAVGTVLSETSFQMVREDVLDFAQRAEAQIAEDFPDDPKAKGLGIVILRNDLMGVPLYLMKDYCATLDPGTIFTFQVGEGNHDLTATHNGGRSTSTMKMYPIEYKVTDTKKVKGKVVNLPSKQVRQYPVGLDFETSPNEVESLDPWIAKALPNKDRQKELVNQGSDRYLFHWGRFATDGFRIHLDTSIPLRTHPIGFEAPDVEHFIKTGKNAPLLASVDTKAFKAILAKASKICNYELTLEFSQDEITLKSISVSKDAHGVEVETVIPLTFPWKFTGTKLPPTLRINTSFLTKAVSGMGKAFDLRLTNDHRMIYITDGKREALISLMHIG